MTCSSVVATVDRIDPVKNTVTAFAPVPQAISDLSAVTLSDGSVATAGGGGCGPAPIAAVDFLAAVPTPPK